ncbi:MAG: tetratricopeptide repeat protein [Planctomycetota bacterium]
MNTPRCAIVVTIVAICGCASNAPQAPTPFERVSANPVPTSYPLPPENRPLARDHYDQGLALQSSGAVSPAADHFTNAASARPRMADAFVHRSAARREGAPVAEPAGIEPGRGFAAADSTKRDYAREDAEQALRVVTELRHPDAWVARGDARRDAGDLPRAIADYSEAIRIYPHYWIAYVRRGMARFDSKDYKGAAEDFAKRLELKPNDEAREEAALRLWVCRAKLSGRAAASAELKPRLKELKGESAEIAAFLVSGRSEFESASGEMSARVLYYTRTARELGGAR